MSRLSLFVPLAIFVLILGVGWIGFSLDDRQQMPSALIDKLFPDFAAPSLFDAERTVTRADILGRPTLVNVWATWCTTCKAEHAELMRIAERTDVQIIGVNYKDDAAKAQRWLADFGDPYDMVVVDPNGVLGIELGVTGAPETFLLDPEGRILYKRVADVNRRIWRDELAPRLAPFGIVERAGVESGLESGE